MIIDDILATLEKAPVFLKELIDAVPREMLKQHRFRASGTSTNTPATS